MGILGYQSMWGSRTPKKRKYRGEDFHFLRSHLWKYSYSDKR